jgi:integrase
MVWPVAGAFVIGGLAGEDRGIAESGGADEPHEGVDVGHPPVRAVVIERRLQPTALARTISRCASRAGLTKHVTAHTLRHTAATWLRQATGDTRLVAEYLGHADLSTVSRYAHVASEEMHAAVQALADETGLSGRPGGAGEQAAEDARKVA